ncbi:hypothetical protein Tco_0787584 [Tanacetum coccineum]
MRMEQYLQCIDYTLWEIIENGNAPIVTKLVDGKETAIPPTSYDWSDQAEEGLTNFSLMAYSSTSSSSSTNSELKKEVELVTKKRIGYNAIPPPYNGNFMPPKPDLVYLVNESASESIVEKPIVKTNEPKTARGTKRNWNQQMSQKLGNDFEIFNKACHMCDSFEHLRKDCNNRSSPISLNAARPVNTVQPRIAVNKVGAMKNGKLQQDLKDKGVIDSGCSRHMTGNRSYLTDYEEIYNTPIFTILQRKLIWGITSWIQQS